MYLYLPESEIRRLAERFVPSASKMARVSALLHAQVGERFTTQGASGGVAWPPRWLGRPASNHLLGTFEATATDDAAQVASGAPGARVQQLGTVGKGGVLPDIRPVRAKALFVPISDRARQQGPTPMIPSARSMRLKQQSAGLVRGKIVDGKVQPPNADYVFLSRVKIPPRPMLPDSQREREVQTRTVAEALKS